METMPGTEIPSLKVIIPPVVTIHVRHSADCKHSSPYFKNCKCRKHLRWSYGGKQYRQSAKTRTWSVAEQVKRKVESYFESVDLEKAPAAAGLTIQATSRKTIEQAVELFVTDKRTQGITPGVIKKYILELNRLNDFMKSRGKYFPADLTIEDLTLFRATWSDYYPSSLTQIKVQERLRGFLRYLHELKLIDRVPRLSPIVNEEDPTLPLDKDQYARLLAATHTAFEDGGVRVRMRGLVQLMRHTGLAMGDAVTLESAHFSHDPKRKVWRVRTVRQKTGTHVSVVIEDDVAKDILAAKKLNKNPRYIFWNRAEGKAETVVKNYHAYMRRAFDGAGLKDGHGHQLRDTFAVELLNKGVPLEEVSKLLGHQSIKTTEKDYAKWVQSRQDRLDRLVEGTWSAA